MKYAFAAALLCLLAWLGWQFIRRRLRGETANASGTRTITRVAIALVAAYAAALTLRIIAY